MKKTEPLYTGMRNRKWVKIALINKEIFMVENTRSSNKENTNKCGKKRRTIYYSRCSKISAIYLCTAVNVYDTTILAQSVLLQKFMLAD